MKFSIITPEHHPKNSFLLELYQSIINQTYTNWEWVLFLNNGCLLSDISDVIRNDPRVNIYQSNTNNTNIGAIKQAAFFKGSGDILVEVDHDDLIVPNCLEELYTAYQDPNVGFVYSDNAILDLKNEFVPYNHVYGWTYEKYDLEDQSLIHMHSFEPSSHALSYIWFAPDHIRSWRTDIYKSIGGHNPNLSICDDHDLCIRTYLITKMIRIPKVLYIYRITGNNTWLLRNADIQTKTVELFNQYARQLAEKDAKDKNLLCVDLGGGLNPLPGYLTVDIRENADIVCDLNEGIPLPDNSVGVVNASHIIEHLYDKTKIMSEIYRVLAHGGWAFIEVPSTDGRGAFQDPTHVSYWNENSFLYYTDAYLANFIDNKNIRFQEYRKDTTFPNEWLKSMDVCVTTVWLVSIKEGNRLPGELKI